MKETTRGCTYCSVYGCLNSSLVNPFISYFRHPLDVERRAKWLQLIGREDLADKRPKSYAVCEEHFKPEDIISNRVRKLLKKNSLPSLRLPNRQGKVESTIIRSEDMEIVITEDLSAESSVTLKFPLEPGPSVVPSEKITASGKRIMPPESEPLFAECSKKIKKEADFDKKTFLKDCDRFLSEELASLVKKHIYSKNESSGKHSYDKQNFCLNLYWINPQAYRLLQSMLCLPCPKTLNKLKIPVTTDINSKIMSMLESQVKNMTKKERTCSVIMDGISLKPIFFYNVKRDNVIGFQDINGVKTREPAVKAFVMMVRGLHTDWKLPAGYALISESGKYIELNKWIDEMLEKLFDIGLNVRTFVTDTRFDILHAARNRSVTTENPYFFIKDKKIYHIFNASSLIKLVRNFFIGLDFFYKRCAANYQYVIQFYENDKTKQVKLAPKLTRSHIYPTNFEQTNVKYAVELLSNTVAAGISHYIDADIIVKSGRDTVDFIRMMNNLFDILNSSSLEGDDLRTAFSGKDTQMNFLNEMLILFNDLKLRSKGCKVTNVNFNVFFLITIQAVLQLFNDIKSEGYKHLMTKRLSLDVLENFFDKIRSKQGIISDLTVVQFTPAFRNFVLYNHLLYSKTKKSMDLGTILTETDNQCEKDKLLLTDQDTANEAKSDGDVKIVDSDFNQFELPNKNVLFEVVLFLLRKCIKKHKNCLSLRTYVKPYQRIHNFGNDSRYTHYRKYSKNECKSLLMVPCDQFVEYVKEIDRIFAQYFQVNVITKSQIADLLYKRIKFVSFPSPCPCFPKDYLIKLYVSLGIHNCIKMNNNNLCAGVGNRRFYVNTLPDE